jgi:archaellum component FlaC
MSQRISLTRVIAINWYGFRQVFDVSDNVLISGGFGTGKSALLDLMQYVLLGEHWRANRAAAGNARGRDLVGYCLGDTNQPGKEGGRHFLRRSGVTLIALEFTHPAERGGQEPKRETWGVRLEFSSPDARPKQTYFFIPDRLEYAQVAPSGKILGEDEFKTWLRREGFGDFLLTERQGEYLKEMATPRHLNFDDVAFQKTFPKAIAFELEDSVERFIREFILEESPLEVAEVRNALRAYDDTRRRLEKQENEAAFLRRIGEQHDRYETSRREVAVLQHIGHTLKLLQDEERHKKFADELQRLESEHAEDLKQLESAQSEAARIKNVLGSVRFQVSKDPDAVKISELKGEITPLQNKVRVLSAARTSVRQQMDDRHYRWTQWLKHGAALPLEGLSDVLEMDDALLGRFRSGTDAERLDAMARLAARFQQMWLGIEKLAQPLSQNIKDAEKRLQQLAADLENLSQGQAPGAFPLFQALRQKLGDRVEQLGRLIEVKPEAERWWPALELFLARNRWVLVVKNPEDYRIALDILRKTPPGREPESLLNPHEASQLRAHAREQSLFTKVEVVHPVARHFVEHLLGDVLCVETLEELESTDAARAITPEGIFKQAPLRRRLKSATTVELTLGREGLARMKATKEKEQLETRAEHTALKQRLGDIQRWLTTGKEGGLDEATLPDLSAELPQLPDYEKKLGSLRETIKLLLTPELEARQKQLEDLEANDQQTNAKIAVLIERRNRFDLTTKPQREALARTEEDVKSDRLEVAASRTQLGQSFTGILEAELLQRRDEFRAQSPKWADCFNAITAAATTAGQTAAEARQKRNYERVLLATSRDTRGNLVHPEYSNEWSAEDESNDHWASRLRHLETIELAKSRQLAVDRKADWERRLQDNVLNELNQRISAAQKTIHLLDGYLSQPVGKFRYRISQRKDTAGYGAIWALLNSGLEPTDPLMASIHGDEIQKAKDELMWAVNATGSGDGVKDDRFLRLLDYRNYHHYDVEMVPADNPKAPAISLGRSGRNLSGGESQAPFFISMLAAFRRVYDRGDRSSVRSQRLGLVVMDEAFSKLSGDGIEDCLTLARNFQLQLVMAFPPERLGVMVPHSQTVVMCKKDVERDNAGYVTNITNIPLISTMAEAVEALS